MREDLQDGKTCENAIAEPPATPALIGEVGWRAEQGRVVSQSEREFMDLVFPLTAGQGREVNGDFLQAEDVEVGKLARSAHDAGRVDFPVDTPTPLDVPADDDHLHGLLRSGSAETRANRRSQPALAGSAQSRCGSERQVKAQWHLD